MWKGIVVWVGICRFSSVFIYGPVVVFSSLVSCALLVWIGESNRAWEEILDSFRAVRVRLSGGPCVLCALQPPLRFMYT